MTGLRVAWVRLIALFRRSDRERQLGGEIQTHLELLADEYVRAGLPLGEAKAAARRSFGGVEPMKERFRDQHRWASVDTLVHDLRFAVRLLAKDRRFTLGAVLALALGISVNNMVFTFVNAVLLRDLPVARPEQLVALNTRDARGREAGVSYPDFVDWINGTSGLFSDVVATVGRDMNLSDEDQAPERFRGSYMSGNAFRMYGMRPVLGRGFTFDDEKPGATAVVILNDRVWQSRYRAAPEILGRTIRVNGVPSTVVGIMPAGFRSPLQNAQVLQPLQLFPDLPTGKRDARVLRVDGRLRDGVSLDQAATALNTIGADLSRQYPETNRGVTPTVVQLSEIYKRSLRPILAVLMVAVGFVLLIACANVANLLLARAADRSREIALRASLGATRWRIVRQLLVESVVLALLGGVLGLLLSVYQVQAFSVVFDGKEVGGTDVFRPFWLDLSMDWRVFAFLAVLCLGSSIVFGLVPALHVSRTDVHRLLKDGGRGTAGSVRTRRWASALVIGELVLAVVLLTSAGLTVRSAIAAYRTSLAFDTSDLFTMRLALPTQTYRTPEQRKAFLNELEERLRTSRAITSATLASNLPFIPGGRRMQLSVDGDHPAAPGQPVPLVTSLDVGPRYFETLGVRLLRGRLPNERDAGGEQGVIVNQRLASVFFSDTDPIGQRIDLTDSQTPNAPPVSFTIVGVSPTLPQSTFPPSRGRMPEPVVYVPLDAQAAPDRVAFIIVRGQAGLNAAASQMRELVRALDPDLPLYFIRTMDDVADELRWPAWLTSALFGFLAGIAFVLASIGLYAITAHAVRQRTAEIGVRVALGAKTPQVMWLFLQRTLAQIAIGLALGLAGALAAGNILRGVLMQTDAHDPLTLISVGILLVFVSLAACAVPTWRATRLSPVDALRHE